MGGNSVEKCRIGSVQRTSQPEEFDYIDLVQPTQFRNQITNSLFPPLSSIHHIRHCIYLYFHYSLNMIFACNITIPNTAIVEFEEYLFRFINQNMKCDIFTYHCLRSHCLRQTTCQTTWPRFIDRSLILAFIPQIIIRLDKSGRCSLIRIGLYLRTGAPLRYVPYIYLLWSHPCWWIINLVSIAFQIDRYSYTSSWVFS